MFFSLFKCLDICEKNRLPGAVSVKCVSGYVAYSSCCCCGIGYLVNRSPPCLLQHKHTPAPVQVLLKSYIFFLKFMNQLSEHTIYKRLANIIFLLLVFSTLLVDPVGVRLKTAMVEYSATVSAAGVRVRIRWVCVYQQAGKEIGHNCNNMRRWMELTNIFPIYWFGESQVVLKDKIVRPKRLNFQGLARDWKHQGVYIASADTRESEGGQSPIFGPDE